MARTATLGGNRRNPYLLLRFGPRENIPHGVRLPAYTPPVRRGRRVNVGRPYTLLDWVRLLPGRRWDEEAGAWRVTNPGPDADRVLAELGFQVDFSRGAKAGFTCCADLATPVAWFDPQDEWTTLVNPRFSDAVLPAGSFWDKAAQVWRVYTPDLADYEKYPWVDRDLGARALMLRDFGACTTMPQAEGQRWPEIFARMPRAPKKPAPGMPPLPDWLGASPYGYQVAGTYSVLASHRLLADLPGVGKSAQAIIAHGIIGTERLVVTCPPVAATNWVRELADLWKYAHRRGAEPDRPGQGEVVMIIAGRKVPDLPERGVVVVPDPLLASRPTLTDDLSAWLRAAGDKAGIAADESHRHKEWTSARSLAVRRLAHACGKGLRIAMSGSAALADVVELAPQLDITGQLQTVFGGLDSFLNTYARQDNFGGWTTRKRMLPVLADVMKQQVWVMRGDEVYEQGNGPSMPAVLPPRVRYVDVDLRLYMEALANQQAKILDWADGLGHPVTDADIEDFAADALQFMSPLRKAAGVCKAQAAAEYIQDWVDAHPDGDDPLVVWAHHQEVQQAVFDAAAEAVGKDRVGLLSGGQSAVKRGEVVARFQAGELPVIICSIMAAGVAVTLTRGRANLFSEATWTPGEMDQAIRRTKRNGQTRSITSTTLIATGTLDEHIQRVQQRKAADLDVLTGRDNDTSVIAGDDLATPRQIVTDLVHATLGLGARKRPVRRLAVSSRA